MKFHGFCPRCNAELGDKHHSTGNAICECGWFDTSSTKTAMAKAEKKTISALAGLAIVMIAGYAHLMSWGSYSMQIPLVKVQQITGTLSPAGYIELADQCIGLGKWSCAKDAYLDLYHASGDVAALASLASLQTRLGEPANAMITYGEYRKVGGKDGDALLRFAHLLEVADRTDEAFQTYEDAIVARPEVLPVVATGAIVRMLMKQGKVEEAYKRLTEFRESAGNAKGYLNTEYDAIEAARNPKKASKKREA